MQVQAVVRAIQSVKAALNSTPGNPVVGEVWLSGLLHGEERRAMQHIARQLCTAFQVPFSKGASVAENMTFLRDMLYEFARCAAARTEGCWGEVSKTCLFVDQIGHVAVGD